MTMPSPMPHARAGRIDVTILPLAHIKADDETRFRLVVRFGPVAAFLRRVRGLALPGGRDRLSVLWLVSTFRFALTRQANI